MSAIIDACIRASCDRTTESDYQVIETYLPGGIKYHLGRRMLFSLTNVLADYPFDRLFVIATDPVSKLYGKALCDALSLCYSCDLLLIADGESNKNLHSLSDLCERLVEQRVTKDSVLIGLGGGVVGNVTGLVAALVYRGIRFVEVPTTTTALTDSVLSNKQAVNGRAGKNHFGVYYPPIFIWGDTATALTEPDRVRKSGIVETIKNGFISMPPLLDYVEDALRASTRMSEQSLHELILRSVSSKVDILKRDPSERGYAVILEYGHTIGHALEYLSKGVLLHGEAIAIGMLAEALISTRLGILPGAACDRHRYLLEEVLGMDLRIPRGLTVPQILNAIEADNKRSAKGVRYVLLESIGSVLNRHGDWLASVDRQVVGSVLESLMQSVKS